MAIPLGGVSRRSGTQLVKADVVPFQLTALLIGGLNKVCRPFHHPASHMLDYDASPQCIDKSQTSM